LAQKRLNHGHNRKLRGFSLFGQLPEIGSWASNLRLFLEHTQNRQAGVVVTDV
jgi:hypothetical protein